MTQECDQFHPDLPCEPREARNHNIYCVTVSRVRAVMCATRMTDVRCPVPCGLIGREAHEPREGTRGAHARMGATRARALARDQTLRRPRGRGADCVAFFGCAPSGLLVAFVFCLVLCCVVRVCLFFVFS